MLLRKLIANTYTLSHSRPIFSPFTYLSETMFGEILTLHFNQSYCQTGLPTIVLTIADNVSKRCLAKFNIPISTTFFPSYRQLTLLLRSVSPAADMTAIPHVRLSITNIDTTISCTRILEREYEDQVVFLEMNLRGFSRIPLPFEANAICAVRLVSDGQEYANRLKTLQKRFQSGFPFTAPPLQPHVTLDFDVKGQVLNESNLSRDIYVKGLIYNRGRKPRVPLSEIEDDAPYYQMTVAKGIQLMENNTHVSSNPVWNQNFVFLIDPVSLSMLIDDIFCS